MAGHSQTTLRLSVILSLWLTLVGAGSVPVNATDSPTPFTALGCINSVPGDSDWIWQTISGTMQSCNLGVRGDIAGMCLDEHGVPDHTSIYVNAAATTQRSGCFAWKSIGCSVDLRRVARVEFDFDLRLCDGVWVAPLWMSPTPWGPPGAMSGEIDFVENCPLGQLHTNFATGGVQKVIGSPYGLGGPKHMIMKLEDSGDVNAPGTLTTQICDFGGTNCKASSYYPNYMSTVLATKGKAQSDPFEFVSDIWNGYGGDTGWWGCHAQNDPGTECTYVIRNIQVFTNDHLPMFDTSGSPCAALNGDAGPGPAPPPPPAPAPQKGWEKHSGINCWPGHGAELVPGDDPNVPISSNMTLAECEAACLQAPACEGVLMPSNGSPQCFRRASINIPRCLPDEGYNLFLHGDKSSLTMVI